MKTQKNPTYSYIFKKAREKRISMEKLAAACSCSRSTLYRYLKVINGNWPEIEQLLIQALQLTYAEQQELAQTLPKEGDPTLFSAAYPVLDKLLSGDHAEVADWPMDFVYLANGEKYLRTAAEMTETILASVDTDDTDVAIRIVGCAGNAFFPFIRRLLEGLFQGPANVTAEHLLNIPTDNEQYAAQVFSTVFSLLRYQKYQVFYSESAPVQRETSAYQNQVLIRQTSGGGGRGKEIYYIITMSPNALSQCIQCRDPAVFDFFSANYSAVKQSYKNTLMLSKNLSGLSEQLSDFESYGTICIFKPDFCYNHIPPEVYQRLFSRMTEDELDTLVTAVNGGPVTKSEQPHYLHAFLSILASRNKASKQNPNYLVCSREKLQQFAETGWLNDRTIPFPQFTPEERGLVLKELYKRVVSKNDTLKIIALPHSVFPGHEVISVNHSKGIMVNFGGNSRHGVCHNVFIENQYLCDILTGYAKHMYFSQQFYSPDGCAMLLKKAMKALE